MHKLIGPFIQIVTMDNLPLNGPIKDSELHIVEKGGVVISDTKIVKTDDFELLRKTYNIPVEEIFGNFILLPGFIDAHTHICFAGSRAHEYSKKIEGLTYKQILAEGGGIHHTVKKTREATFNELKSETFTRIDRHFYSGVTTVEIKSGYGLSLSDEIKMLEVVGSINMETPPDLVSTCLAAHMRPMEFDNNRIYLDYVVSDILPAVREKDLAGRVDIFIDDDAFKPDEAERFLKAAKKLSFSLTVHADQFSVGGSKVAATTGAVSADHLEASGLDEIKRLIDHGVISVVLPGASLGLAMPFAPARLMLDEGACLVIASDWNPGSAPMGDLLIQSALLSNSEKLSFAETLAGITYRAARALDLSDRGVIGPGKIADMISFPTDDYREILYNQGMLKPDSIWKNGNLYSKKPL
jgi:imidazolonepropionase